MIKKQLTLWAFLLFILGSSCNTQKTSSKLRFSAPEAGSMIRLGTPLLIKLDIPERDKPVDSIVYLVDGAVVSSRTNLDSLLLPTEQFQLGKRAVSAKVYKNGEEKVVQSDVHVVPAPPKFYSYKVIREFPHDPEAFTQGLEIYGDHLYESTGQYEGKSSLRRTNLQTGEVLKKIHLDGKYFGEGITRVDDKIIQLTWREKTGFVYDLKTFEKIGEFQFDGFPEGWGICYDGTHLIVSDGSHHLYFLDKSTYKLQHQVQVYNHKGPQKNLNELEFIDGKVYANVYQEDVIVIIDPKTGAVEGEINLLGIYPEKEDMMYDNELNGIAYNHKTKQLFVTGKNWAKLFEIELVSR